MTPKFRPFAFRRLLIAAAGASLAFSAVPAKGANLYWTGPNNDGNSNGYLESGQAFKNFTTIAPTGGTAWTPSPAINTTFTTGDDIFFSRFAQSTVVTVGAQTTTLGSLTVQSATTANPNVSVQIIGGSIDGGIAGSSFINIQAPSSSTASTSLNLSNINSFYGTVDVAGNLIVSNAQALGKTGNGNETIVNQNYGSTSSTYGSLTLSGGIEIKDETLKLYGAGNTKAVLVNSLGSNVYSGPVKLSGVTSVLVTANSGTSLEFKGALINEFTGPSSQQLQLQAQAGSNIIISGGIVNGTSANASAMSLYLTSAVGTTASTAGGIVTIGTTPIQIATSLIVGGGVTVNLNGQIQAAGTNPLGTVPLALTLGDQSGAGILNVQNTTALAYITQFVINEGSFSALNIKNGASLYIGAKGYVDFSAADLTMTGNVIQNQNTTPNSLNFSAKTGTVTLTSGIGSTVAGAPSPGAVHFGSNAVIGTISTSPGLAVQGGVADGIITVDGNLTTPYIAGGTTTVKGNLSVVTGGTLSTTAETTPSGFIRGDGNSFATNLNVAGSLTAGNITTINGNNLTVTVGGDIRLTSATNSISSGTVAAGANVYADQISGGTVTIAGQLFANANSSGPSISGGVVTINGTGVSQIYQLSGGTVNLNSPTSGINQYTGGSINLKSNSVLNISSGNVIGQFSGVGMSMAQSGGVLNITGKLAANATFNIPTSVQNILSGTINFNADSSLTTMTGGNAIIASGKSLIVLGNQANTAVISGAGSVGFYSTSPSSYYVINGTNTYTGGTSLQAGIVCVGNNSALGAGTTPISIGTTGATPLTAGIASTSTTTNTISNETLILGDFTLGDAVYNGGLTLSGVMDLNGLTRVITTNSDVTISGIIKNGGINKAGNGKLTLTGLNTYSGVTLINGGTLAGTTDNFTAVSYTVNSGTTLELSQNTDGAFNGNIDGAGRLAKSGTGKVTLTGLNAYTGGTVVTAGTLSGTTDNIRGPITTSGAGTLEFNQAGTTPVSFGGTFSGSGTVQKTGTAALTTTSNIVAGSVVVNGGTLIESGGIKANVLVNAGGTLKGSGTIVGNVTVNGGTVDLGNSPAIVTTYGNYSQTGGTFISEIGGTTPGNSLPGFHDQYNVVGGSFTITGAAKLQLNSWYASGTTPFVPSRGDSFNIINASNGIVGGFNAVDNNVDSQQTLVFAQHSGAVYALGRAYGTSPQKFGDIWVGTTPANATQRSVYNAIYDASVTSGNSTTPSKFIDGTSADGRLAIAIIKDTTNAAYNISDFSAETYFGVTDYVLTVTRAVTDAALNQPVFYKQKRWAVGANYNYVSNKFHGGSSAAFDRSLSSQTGFFTVNYSITDDASVGLFAGFNSGKTSTNTTGFDYKGELMGVTGKLHFNGSYPVDIKAALVNSSLSVDSHRTMFGVSDAAGVTSQKLKETSFAVQADIQTMRADRWMVFTNLGLSYGNATTDAFTESGSVMGLSVNGLSQKSTQASVGISTKYYQSLKLSYDLSAKLEKDFGSSSTLMAKYRVSTGAMSDVNNPSSGQTAVALGGGLTYKPTASSLFTAGAELRGSSDYSSDVRLNLSYKRKF